MAKLHNLRIDLSQLLTSRLIFGMFDTFKLGLTNVNLEERIIELPCKSYLEIGSCTEQIQKLDNSSNLPGVKSIFHTNFSSEVFQTKFIKALAENPV